MTHSVVIAGLEIPADADGNAVQHRYRSALRETDLPMADGSVRRQRYAGAAAKLVVELTVAGAWAPAGLDGIDTSVPQFVRCGAPRSIAAATPSIAVPPSRRSDASVLGWALVGGRRVSTQVTVTADVAALTPVTGATGYVVDYWPEINAWLTIEQGADVRKALFDWRITAREV